MSKISNRKPANKLAKSAAHSFMLNKTAAMKMEALSLNEDEFSLVRNDKDQLFIRTYWPEIKKAGKWQPLPFRIWSCPDKLIKMGWDTMTQRQKRVNYKMTPVTRAQAAKWLIDEYIPEEFEADFYKGMCDEPGKKKIIITVTKEQHSVISKLCARFRLTPEEVAKSAFLHNLYQDEDNWHHVLTDATEEEAMGIHPAWAAVEEYAKENLA